VAPRPIRGTMVAGLDVIVTGPRKLAADDPGREEKSFAHVPERTLPLIL
jgi:hypothetical protein